MVSVKVVVSALGPTLDDLVDERFGRARYLLIADTDGSLSEVKDNSTNRNALQGAGIASAEFVAECGAQAVLTGHLGPKAFDALLACGIRGYNATGMTVRAALAALSAGVLNELSEAGDTFSK